MNSLDVIKRFVCLREQFVQQGTLRDLGYHSMFYVRELRKKNTVTNCYLLIPTPDPTLDPSPNPNPDPYLTLTLYSRM